MSATYNAPLVPTAAPAYSTVLCSTPEQMQRALAIRHKVFCEEQGYDPAIEVDELSLSHPWTLRKGRSGCGRWAADSLALPTDSMRSVITCS